MVAGALTGGGGIALASGSHNQIHGCVNNQTHALAVQKKCKRGTKALTWNRVGPRGERGATGKTGVGSPDGGDLSARPAPWAEPT